MLHERLRRVSHFFQDLLQIVHEFFNFDVAVFFRELFQRLNFFGDPLACDSTTSSGADGPANTSGVGEATNNKINAAMAATTA